MSPRARSLSPEVGSLPDSRLTLRQAFDRHYDRAGLSRTWLHQLDVALSLWAQLTRDPPIGDATNKDLEAFRDSYAGRAGPRTVNNTLTTLRTIFRRLAAPSDGNPAGLGIIDRAPYARPLRTVQPAPRRVSLEDLSRVYIAAGCATQPVSYGAPPREFWRCLLVVAYFTGLRRGDLAALRFSQIEPDGIRFTAQKTGKADVFPFHALAREHVARVAGERELIFGKMLDWGKDHWNQWRRIVRRAAVPLFTLHDIRRTGASEVPADWNPIPCSQLDGEPKYSLYFPPEARAVDGKGGCHVA